MSIRTLSTRVVYENPWLRVREDAIERADGSRGVYAVVEKTDGALVVPWDGERVTLVGQVKYPVGGFSGSSRRARSTTTSREPEEIARTELAEETGLRAGALEHLGRFYSPRPCRARASTLWLATDLEQGEARPEATEVGMRPRAVTRDEFERMIRDGRDDRRALARRVGAAHAGGGIVL